MLTFLFTKCLNKIIQISEVCLFNQFLIHSLLEPKIGKIFDLH